MKRRKNIVLVNGARNGIESYISPARRGHLRKVMAAERSLLRPYEQYKEEEIREMKREESVRDR